MKALVCSVLLLLSCDSYLVVDQAAANGARTVAAEPTVHNLLRGEVSSSHATKDVATVTRRANKEQDETKIASTATTVVSRIDPVVAAERNKHHLLQQQENEEKEEQYYNPTEWWKDAVVLSAEDNNATSTSRDESIINTKMDSMIRSGQDSQTTIAGVNTTLPAGGDVACKVDKSILVITHVLRGAFDLEDFPAFTIANRLYMALDINGQRILDQVLYQIPIEPGLQKLAMNMLEMFRHVINHLGMVFVIEHVATVHDKFAPVIVEIMKFMYQVDGYPDKGMYNLSSYMNSTRSFVDTLEQSIQSCFHHVTHCQDNVDYYYFDETSFCLRTCALIGHLDTKRRLAMCQKQEVMDNCPFVCGSCCEDDPTYEILVQDENKAEYVRGCSWLTEDPSTMELRRNMYCDNIVEDFGRMIRHYCPLSCDSCFINGPTEAPTVAPTQAPTDISRPTMAPTLQTPSPVHDPTLAPTPTPTKQTQTPTLPPTSAPTVQVVGHCTAYTSNVGKGSSSNNSVCEQAFHLSADSSMVCGTVHENQTLSISPLSCTVVPNKQGPPSWYTLEGTGERIMITTCTNETTIDTVVAVYESHLCSSNSCLASTIHDVRKPYYGSFSHWSTHSLAASDDDTTCKETGVGASTVVFDSVAGQMYKLYVSEKGPGRQGGSFGLKATSMKAPANDRCETAINLNTDGVEVIGSTVNATIDWQVVESCAFSQQNIRGASVWYTLEGTGERIMITTCSKFTDMNTVLAVYDQSNCNSNNCLASTIHDVRKPYYGSFSHWTFPSLAASDDDTTCKETGVGASTVVFDSVAGQMYKLYVSEKGPGRQGGSFGLKATSMKAPANDRCETAINLNTDGVEVIGSTVNATIDWQVVESCAFSQQNIRGASVWYTLEGTGERIMITTCSKFTDMNTVLAVYDQSNCNSNKCLASTIHDVRAYDGSFSHWTFPSLAASDDDTTCKETGVGASTVVFDSVAGQMYKLYVSEKGPGRQGGSFGLKATSMKAPANDRCETAINLNTDGVEVIGSTVNATIDWQVVESCAFSRQNIRGASVWYRLQGTGKRIRVTTCSINTNFDSVLAVYKDGACDKYSCFVSNDNDSTCNVTGMGASTVSFDTVSGQIYKLYVSSKSRSSEGQFGLTASSVDDGDDV